MTPTPQKMITEEEARAYAGFCYEQGRQDTINHLREEIEKLPLSKKKYPLGSDFALWKSGYYYCKDEVLAILDAQTPQHKNPSLMDTKTGETLRGNQSKGDDGK